MSCFDTCFFERYAHETLRRCLGHEYDDLVNRDRPDLQSPDGVTFGIEVTRAMEESKTAAEQMLDNMAGYNVTPEDTGDMEQLLLHGYGYGLNVGRHVSPKESLYWSMALPMKRILETKLSKLIDGFYGDFEKNGLYVFCKEDITDVDVLGACKRMLRMQAMQDRRYDLLYLSGLSALHVCNLSEDINDTFRISTYEIPLDLRHQIYYAAL